MKEIDKYIVICIVAFAVIALNACGDDSSAVSNSKFGGSEDVKIAWDYLHAGFDYGEFTDVRDDQVYKTVEIGNQTWMAENLNFNYNEETAKSYCYKNEASNCAKYGRLYIWSAAMDSAAIFSDDGAGCGYGKNCSASGAVRGVCPDGWHLPSYDEWEALFVAIGDYSSAGSKLKSQAGWYGNDSGTDDYGFSALPAGVRFNYYYFGNVNNNACFWSSGQNEENYAYYMGLRINSVNANLNTDRKDYAFSVRCLKNFIEKVKSYSDSNSQNTARDGLNSGIDYGEFSDERDGQVYKTVKIGNQTWMSENLNFEYNEGTAKSYCYKNSADSCAKYGRLYLWSAAMDSAAVFTDNGAGCGYFGSCSASGMVRGVCPEGWHLPSRLDWETLVTAVGGASTTGMMLKSQTGWYNGGNGEDAYGFSALPGGVRSDNGVFDKVGRYCYFWLASLSGFQDAAHLAYLNYYYYYGYEGLNIVYKTDCALSVRCLKD